MNHNPHWRDSVAMDVRSLVAKVDSLEEKFFFFFLSPVTTKVFPLSFLSGTEPQVQRVAPVTLALITTLVGATPVRQMFGFALLVSV